MTDVLLEDGAVVGHEFMEVLYAIGDVSERWGITFGEAEAFLEDAGYVDQFRDEGEELVPDGGADLSEHNLRAGDSIEFTVDAEVVCTYSSDRVKVRWESGEETIHPSDARLQNDR